MNKKEKEQLELNNLLQECINEQLKIGLHPALNIEIYIEKDPITGSKCSNDSHACADIYDDTKRKVILIKRKSYNTYPINELKALIHHELIHLNLKKNGNIIQHIDDWAEFKKLSEKINKFYKINPLSSYEVECFKEKKIRYNGIARCNNCGFISHYLIDYNLDYDFNSECPNCGKKLVYEKKTSDLC